MAHADVNAILAEAEAELTAALSTDPHKRLAAINRFMKALERVARQVAAGEASWDDTRPWAARNAEKLRSARQALSDWEVEMGRFVHEGGEERIEWGLDRRSQHAFAREVFRDTPADEMLAAYEDDDEDKDFREAAELAALDGPSWLPRTHTWWRWPKPT